VRATKLTEKQVQVLNAAEGISFAEWLKVSEAITKTFDEQERQRRKEMRLENIGRAARLAEYP